MRLLFLTTALGLLLQAPAEPRSLDKGRFIGAPDYVAVLAELRENRHTDNG
jgi:hypothetical protein